jgi:hypothetical protein
VLGGVCSDVVKTLIDLQGATILQETRSLFQEEMQHRFIAEIERLSGRGAQAFISNSHVDPEFEIELFMLKPSNGLTSKRRPASRGYASHGSVLAPSDRPNVSRTRVDAHCCHGRLA